MMKLSYHPDQVALASYSITIHVLSNCFTIQPGYACFQPVSGRHLHDIFDFRLISYWLSYIGGSGLPDHRTCQGQTKIMRVNGLTYLIYPKPLPAWLTSLLSSGRVFSHDIQTSSAFSPWPWGDENRIFQLSALEHPITCSTGIHTSSMCWLYLFACVEHGMGYMDRGPQKNPWYPRISHCSRFWARFRPGFFPETNAAPKKETHL